MLNLQAKINLRISNSEDLTANGAPEITTGLLNHRSALWVLTHELRHGAQVEQMVACIIARIDETASTHYACTRYEGELDSNMEINADINAHIVATFMEKNHRETLAAIMDFFAYHQEYGSDSKFIEFNQIKSLPTVGHPNNWHRIAIAEEVLTNFPLFIEHLKRATEAKKHAQA
jgi:hypothetical protein